MLSDLKTLLPGLIILWGLLIICVAIRPQGLINSFILMLSIFYTLFTVGIVFSNIFPYLPLVMFIATDILILIVPILLIINGVNMIRHERPSFSNMLSLLLGAVIATGEVAGALILIFDGIQLDIGRAGLLALFIFGTVVYFSAIMLAFVVYVFFFGYLPHGKNFDYIVIHGSGLIDGKRMSKLLQNRVDKAIELYRKCKSKPILIPSGGKGDDEALSEAEAMKQYLLEQGIPDESIICESLSRTTMENLINSKAIIESRPGKRKTALVTSNYHVYRCIMYASKLKWKCVGIGANVASYYWMSAAIREFAAVFADKKKFILLMLGYIIIVVLPILLTLIGG